MLFNEIYTYLFNTLNCSFSCGHMNSSQKQAMITLIEKKGRDKILLKSWRPISLISVDARITSKALALQIRKILGSLIRSDQNAYVNPISSGIFYLVVALRGVGWGGVGTLFTPSIKFDPDILEH